MAPLEAVNGAGGALGVLGEAPLVERGPQSVAVPNAHALLLQMRGVGVAPQEPTQLFGNAFEKHFFRREQRKAKLGHVKFERGAKTAARVAVAVARRAHLARVVRLLQQVQVGILGVGLSHPHRKGAMRGAVARARHVVGFHQKCHGEKHVTPVAPVAPVVRAVYLRDVKRVDPALRQEILVDLPAAKDKHMVNVALGVVAVQEGGVQGARARKGCCRGCCICRRGQKVYFAHARAAQKGLGQRFIRVVADNKDIFFARGHHERFLADKLHVALAL